MFFSNKYVLIIFLSFYKFTSRINYNKSYKIGILFHLSFQFLMILVSISEFASQKIIFIIIFLLINLLKFDFKCWICILCYIIIFNLKYLFFKIKNLFIHKFNPK